MTDRAPAAPPGRSARWRLRLAASAAGLARYAPLVGYFARRDLKALYKRSILGWTWSLLNPLSNIVVYSLVFSVFFRATAPAAGNGSRHFAIFLFSGLVIWNLFSGLLAGSMTWIASIGELRRKVYFPPEAAVFGSATAVAAQSAIEGIVLVGILAAIGNIGPTTLLLPVIGVAAGLFGLGFGLLLTVLNTRYRDVQHFTDIALRTSFFLTPIVYPLSIVPEDYHGVPLRQIVSLNPLHQFVAAARDAVYLLRWPSAGRWAAVLVPSIAVFALGWRYFAQRSLDISEEM